MKVKLFLFSAINFILVEKIAKIVETLRPLSISVDLIFFHKNLTATTFQNV